MDKPKLFQFAYFKDYQLSIDFLAGLTPLEQWDFME